MTMHAFEYSLTSIYVDSYSTTSYTSGSYASYKVGGNKMWVTQ